MCTFSSAPAMPFMAYSLACLFNAWLSTLKVVTVLLLPSCLPAGGLLAASSRADDVFKMVCKMQC